MVRYGFDGCGDVCAGIGGEVSGEAAEAGLEADLEADWGAGLIGLEATAAQVFGGIAGGVSGGAGFGEETAFDGGAAFGESAAFDRNVDETGAIWMLVIDDRDGFNDEASLVSVLGGVSMLLMLDRESFDDADGGDDADLIWWSRTCSWSLMLLANLAEQRLHAKTSKRAFSSTKWASFSARQAFILACAIDVGGHFKSSLVWRSLTIIGSVSRCCKSGGRVKGLKQSIEDMMRLLMGIEWCYTVAECFLKLVWGLHSS